jgi:sigma-B regulation protein RsbU (phosphoserine phosphatase)
MEPWEVFEMDAASASAVDTFRPQLLDRRVRLLAASDAVPAAYFNELIAEIDAALGRIDNGSYGLCETCRDPIEADRLAQNPLVRFCLDHLSQAELEAHQQDLELAAQIQSKLLPLRDIILENWDPQYRYQPVGAVGGDYCELIVLGNGKSLFFAVGDVAGKGVAASLLMTHLSAIFRSLLSLDLSLTDVISRANRLFCESTASVHYATLVCGRATASGVEICNAGHCMPLLLKQNVTQRLDSTGLPLGLFCSSQYPVQHVSLDPGDSLVLYSDGITESQDPEGNQYEEDRLIRALWDHRDQTTEAMADGVLQDVARFRQTRSPSDDMTLLIVRRRH